MPRYLNWNEQTVGDFTEILTYYSPCGRRVKVQWRRAATGQSTSLLPDGDPDSVSYWSIHENGIYLGSRLTKEAAMDHVEHVFNELNGKFEQLEQKE